MSDMGTIERAYELARSGRFRTVSDLETALIRERHTDAREHLAGLGTRRELNRIMKEAKKKAPAETEAFRDQ
jgi:hypothetical protein